MLAAVQYAQGTAASAAAAAALLPPMLTQLPAAVLCEAIEVNCPGCNPQPAASPVDVAHVAEMHVFLSRLTLDVACFASAACEGKQCCCTEMWRHAFQAAIQRLGCCTCYTHISLAQPPLHILCDISLHS
jgi:hypothetical protein